MRGLSNAHWKEYRRRVQLDAFYASAMALLESLNDEDAIADLEMLRQNNIDEMTRIQDAAYRNCAQSLAGTG
jgi:hypothetical protein